MLSGRRLATLWLARLVVLAVALLLAVPLWGQAGRVSATEPTVGSEANGGFLGKGAPQSGTGGTKGTKGAGGTTADGPAVAALSAPVAGFQDTIVLSGLVNPTSVRFASDGRVFVAEKSGLVKVFSSLTAGTPTVFADLRTNVHNFWDRGLLGMTLHPSFPAQPYVYVLYTYDHMLGDPSSAPRWGTANATSDPCPTPPGATGDGCVVSGRLSRLTANGNVMSGPELVLIEDWCQQFPSHSVGSLEFGPDGALYASAGDGASFNYADWGQGGGTLPNTTSPLIPRNPCGDPPGGVGGAMTAPTAEGGALRAQDLRTRPSGGGGGGGGADYRTTVLADAPAVYYRLAETSGTSAADASPNGRTGTYGGTYTRGTAGLLANDANQAVTLASGWVDLPSAYNPWAGDFTIEAWAKPSQASSYAAILSRETYGVNGLRFGQQGARWAFWTTESGGTVEIRGGTVVAGATAHVVVTRSGTTFRLYVNGAEVASVAGTLVPPAGGGRFGNVGGAPFQGVLDEATVYSSALSATRIAAHYAAGTGAGGPPGPGDPDPVTLDGSIIRIDPATGLARAGNPLSGDADPNAARIIAEGLRNPFRIAFRPGTSELWIGDVGWGLWEEINRIVSPTAAVMNFGWPCYEGAGDLPSYGSLTLCQNLISSGSSTAPYLTYNHNNKVVNGETCPTGSSAIAGMAFYQGGNYPAAYAGAMFFADHSRNCIWAMKTGANGLPSTSNIETFVAEAANPVDLKIGPNGDLFYVNFEGGAVHRITYLSSNQAPTASFTATPSSGPAPLAVNFDGRASSDPEGGALTYSWDLDGNGTYDDATIAQPSRTYTQPGTVIVGLRVTDPGGATGSTTRTVSVGNDPPVPVIASPAGSLTWMVGDTIAFSGSATDPQDGSVPAARLSWTLLIQHCPSNCHPHTAMTFPGVASGSFAAPDHEYPSYLELQLTATDSTGASATTSVQLQPKTVDLQFETVPSGLQVSVGGSSAATPITRTVILGSANSITTATPQSLGGTSYAFDSWSDGGARTHTVTAPAGGATYTATFTSGGGAPDYASTVLADAPRVYYRLAETSGKSAVDASPNGQTGTYGGAYAQGAAGLIANDPNAATTFTTGRVDLPSSVNPWAGDFTVEAWVKPSQASAYAVVFSRESYKTNGLRFGQQGSRWAFWTTESGGTVEIRGGTAAVNSIYHVVATRSGNTFRLYVNGAEVANGNGTLVTPNGGGQFGAVGGASFQGVLDEAAVYPAALSAATVAAHYAAGTGP